MAGNDQKFTVSVLNESGVLFYGKCDVLFVPTKRDVLAVLAHHTPMIAKLGQGQVVVKVDREKNDRYRYPAGTFVRWRQRSNCSR